MTTYTQEQLLKAVEYACGYQKASSYQEIAHVEGFWDIDERIFKEIMDNLADVDNNAHKEITIEDIDDYLNENTEETELPWKDIK